MKTRRKRPVTVPAPAPAPAEVEHVNRMLAVAEGMVDAGEAAMFDPRSMDFSDLPVMADNRPVVIRVTVLRRAGASYNPKSTKQYYSTMTVLPKAVLEVAGLKVGDPMMVMAWADGTVVLRRAGEAG